MTPMQAAIAAIPTELPPFDRAKLRAMLGAYAASWDDEPADVLAVEVEFQAPLTHPDGTTDQEWLLGGKIDLVLRQRGRVLLWDHKSSSEQIGPGSVYRDRLTLNGQATHYMIGARSIGIEADAFGFDVVKKPGIRPKVAETPDEYERRCRAAFVAAPSEHLARIEIARTEHDFSWYQRTLSAESVLIDTVRKYGLATPNDQACFHYGKPCEFHTVCTGLASLSSSQFEKRDDVHAELANPVPPGRRLLTSSRRGTFNACRWKHDMQYERGYRALAKSDALTFGDAMHKSLEAYWLARKSNQSNEAA